jgi:hypothetical protein
LDEADYPGESSVSAISWKAIFGGAVAAAVILVALDPWSWLRLNIALVECGRVRRDIFHRRRHLVVQWLSSGVGGFITGRLRTKWVNVHTHEVYFRSTAHGFLTWAVASLFGVFIVASAATSTIGTVTRAAGTMAAGAAQGAGSAARAYDVDSLFRSQKPELASSNQQTQTETTRILARGMQDGDVPANDRSYLVDQVAARTGIPHDDAQKRVDDLIAQEKAAETKARQVADDARKSASAVSIFTALSMLIAAFTASAAAAYGGSLRNEHP